MKVASLMTVALPWVLLLATYVHPAASFTSLGRPLHATAAIHKHDNPLHHQQHHPSPQVHRPTTSLHADLWYAAQETANTWTQNSLGDGIVALPILYVAGLLTSCSPCVWSLLPLTVSYITSAAGARSDRDPTVPTLVFAAGLASVYGSLGVAAAQMGTMWGGNDGFPWLPLLSNGISFLMGLQLLNLVSLPFFNFVSSSGSNSIINANGNSSNKNNDSDQLILLDGTGQVVSNSNDDENNNNKGLLQTFVLGGSSALVSSPCATPVLTSILAYVAARQDPVEGFALLLTYTAGYATPLLYLAAKGGRALLQLSSGNGSWWTPWVTPVTAGILLYSGTTGLLVALFGDPSVAALYPVLE